MLTQNIPTRRRMTPAEFAQAMDAAKVSPEIAEHLQRRHDAAVPGDCNLKGLRLETASVPFVADEPPPVGTPRKMSSPTHEHGDSE